MQFDQLKRRALLGGAAAWPLAARAQQPAMPVIGYVNSGTAGANVKNIAAFRAGLTEAGFVEGQNVVIEFRWAENEFDRLPALVTDLINRPAAVIVGNTLAALRAKAATATIPIVFTTGSDPVRDGLVTSLARPGGNVTGVVFITGELGTKRLELLRQFIPKARTIAMLVNPNTPETEAERKEIQVAAQKMGLSLIILDVTSGGDIEAAFATLAARLGAPPRSGAEFRELRRDTPTRHYRVYVANRSKCRRPLATGTRRRCPGLVRRRHRTQPVRGQRAA